MGLGLEQPRDCACASRVFVAERVSNSVSNGFAFHSLSPLGEGGALSLGFRVSKVEPLARKPTLRVEWMFHKACGQLSAWEACLLTLWLSLPDVALRDGNISPGAEVTRAAPCLGCSQTILLSRPRAQTNIRGEDIHAKVIGSSR